MARPRKSRRPRFVFSVPRLVLCVALLGIIFVGYLFAPKLWGQTTVFDGTKCLVFHTVDVGQGDCVIVELPDDKVLMVDTGLKSQYPAVKTYLNNLHIKTIDWFVNTHPDADHYGGLPDLLTDFTIGKLYRADYPSTNATYNSIAAQMVVPAAGEQIKGANYTITFVSPYATDNVKNANDASLMMTIEYQNKIFVLTGDASTKMEGLFTQRTTIFADVADKQIILKVGHHGSSTSSGAEFLAAIFNPLSKENNFALISCGLDNKYGHPAPDTLARLAEYCAADNIWTTKDVGDIVVQAGENTLTINGQDYHVSYTVVFVTLGVVAVGLCFFNYQLRPRSSK